jgi:hypothetical protein
MDADVLLSVSSKKAKDLKSDFSVAGFQTELTRADLEIPIPGLLEVSDAPAIAWTCCWVSEAWNRRPRLPGSRWQRIANGKADPREFSRGGLARGDPRSQAYTNLSEFISSL